MVSPLFFSQLALLAVIGLFVMLPLSWLRPSATNTTAPATPITPKRTRATAPKACAGLTPKPHCVLCEHATRETAPPPPVPPNPMPPTNRRPRMVDTARHFWPHADWDDRGGLERNTLRATGHPNGGPGRPCHCLGGHGYCPEPHGTMFHGKQAAVERIVGMLACLAQGLGMRATARGCEVAPNPGLAWRVAAAEPLRAFAAHCLCKGHVNPLPLAEWYVVLREVKGGESSADEASTRLERSPHGVWTAMDPESTRRVVIDVGTRTRERAQRVVPQIVPVLAPGCVPLFWTDGFRE